jgi:hypothetical protein
MTNRVKRLWPWFYSAIWLICCLSAIAATEIGNLPPAMGASMAAAFAFAFGVSCSTWIAERANGIAREAVEGLRKHAEVCPMGTRKS